MGNLSFLIPLLVGAAVGLTAGFFFGRYRSEDANSKAKYEKLQNEFNEYRSNVRSHFIDTVSLLSQIDERQKKLYESVASGVTDLCSSKKDENNYFLEQSAQALVKLEPESTKIKKSDSKK